MTSVMMQAILRKAFVPIVTDFDRIDGRIVLSSFMVEGMRWELATKHHQVILTECTTGKNWMTSYSTLFGAILS